MVLTALILIFAEIPAKALEPLPEQEPGSGFRAFHAKMSVYVAFGVAWKWKVQSPSLDNCASPCNMKNAPNIAPLSKRRRIVSEVLTRRKEEARRLLDFRHS